MPMTQKYEKNNYLNIFAYFCKKAAKTKKDDVSKMQLQMYLTGLELQTKLDKILDYDQCNEDQVQLIGEKPYCI